MKTPFCFKAGFIALLLCPLHLSTFTQTFAQNLTIYACNVGQGNEKIIIAAAGKSMPIDGGNTNAGRDEILSRLSTLPISHEF